MTTDVAFFPPPPRLVRRKSFGSGCGFVFVRLFLLPHVLIGIGLLLSVPQHLYVRHFGTSMTATVDGLDSRIGVKGGTIYTVRYHYQLDGRRFDETDYPDAGTYNATRVGEQFPGVAMSMFGRSLFLAPAKSIGSDMLHLVGMALFWNAFLSVFLYHFWYVPVRQRWTVKSGQAVVGWIEGTSKRSGRGSWSFVSHRFTTPDGQTFTGRSSVTPAVLAQAVVGAPLIILYDPRQPKWNLAYEYCEFVVPDAAMR